MRLMIITLSVLLTGCVPQLLFDKPGMAPGTGQGDLVDCQVEALNKVPPNNVTRVIGGGSVSTYSSCTGNFCSGTSYGGDPSVYSVDQNAYLRDQVTIQCMAKKGYTLRQ